MRAPQNTRLRPIHLAFPSFSPYPRQRRNGEDVLSPQTGALLPLTRSPHPCFFPPPSQSPFLFHSASSLVLLSLIGPSVGTPAPLFLRRLYFAPSCSEAIVPLLSGAFFIPLFSPSLSLSPTFSHTRLTLILMFTYQDGSIRFRRVNEGGVNKRSQQGREVERSEGRGAMASAPHVLRYYLHQPNNTI